MSQQKRYKLQAVRLATRTGYQRRQLVNETGLVGRLQQARAEMPVHLDRRSDHNAAYGIVHCDPPPTP